MIYLHHFHDTQFRIFMIGKMYCRTVYGFHIHQYISYKPKMAKRPKTDVFGSHLGFLEKAPGGFLGTLWEYIKGAKRTLS